MSTTYTRADGSVLDISGFLPEEDAYLDQAIEAYRADAAWEDFAVILQLPDNPTLDGGRITRRTVEHPLFLALLDLEARLGAKQGFLKPAEGDDLERDPLDDEALSVVEAARVAGVTRQTIYNAIEAGDVIAFEMKPTRISRNSLAAWRPHEGRQLAGRVAQAPVYDVPDVVAAVGELTHAGEEATPNSVSKYLGKRNFFAGLKALRAASRAGLLEEDLRGGGQQPRYRVAAREGQRRSTHTR